jgi:hypothetical protein
LLPIQALFTSVVTIVVYGIIVAAVFKLFQIGKDLSEIKDVLQDIKRNTHDLPPPASFSAGAESYSTASPNAADAVESKR